MLELGTVREDINREFDRTIHWYRNQRAASRSTDRRDLLQKAENDAEVLLSEIRQFLDVCDTAASKRVERYRDWQVHQSGTRETLDSISSLKPSPPLSDQSNEDWEQKIAQFESFIEADDKTITNLIEISEQQDQRAEAAARRIADVAIALIRIENDDPVNLWFDRRREAIKLLLMYVRLRKTLYW